MREIRTSGSEGGGAGNLTGPPYPYHEQRPMNGASNHGFFLKPAGPALPL